MNFCVFGRTSPAARSLVLIGNAWLYGCRALPAEGRMCRARDWFPSATASFRIEHVVVIAGFGCPGPCRCPSRPTPPSAFERGVTGSSAPAIWITGGGLGDFAFSGSSTGRLSVEYSGEPYSGPLALTVGLRWSVEIRSWR